MKTERSDEQHRKECEARKVLTMPKVRRQAYYKGVEEKRGTKAAKELVAEVKRQYKLRERESAMEM